MGAVLDTKFCWKRTEQEAMDGTKNRNKIASNNWENGRTSVVGEPNGDEERCNVTNKQPT